MREEEARVGNKRKIKLKASKQGWQREVETRSKTGQSDGAGN